MSNRTTRLLPGMVGLLLTALPSLALGETAMLRLPAEWEEARSAEPPATFWLISGTAPRLTLPENLIHPEEEVAKVELPTYRRDRVTRASELRWLALGTALLIPTDRSTVELFDPDLHKNPAGDEEGRMISKLGTGLPLLALIAAPALVGGSYGRQTTRLTVMALVNTTLEVEALKYLTGRERPRESGGRVRFRGPGSGFASFPSGHTAAAFAVAEVIGNRHKRLKLPLYLLAAGVSWGRINSASHFPADVLVGAAIGIYNGRLVLRRGGRLHVWH